MRIEKGDGAAYKDFKLDELKFKRRGQDKGREPDEPIDEEIKKLLD